MTVATAGVQYAVAGKDAHLSLIVKGSHPDGTAAKFEVKKALDDSVLDTIDGQIKKNKAETIWPAKGPEETGSERAHRVYYVVTVDDKEKTTSPEIEVYHDAIEVTSQKEDGSSLPDVAFVITVKRAGKNSKHEVKANTGSTGVFKVEGLPPGDVELSFKSPARFVEWAEEPTATKRKAKLKPGLKATLEWPPKGTHKQWVNHKAKKDQPDQGSTLKVRVAVSKADGPSRKGDELFLKLEYPPAADLSKRSKPARGSKGAKEVPGAATRTLLTSKLIEKDGAGVEFEVELGLAGGDTVKVHVGGTEACEDEVVEVTNWRKVYYHLFRPGSITLPDLARSEERLASVFVVFERVEETVFSEGDTPAEWRGSWMLGRTLGFPSDHHYYATKMLFVGYQNMGWFESKTDRTRGKLVLTVTVCHMLLDGANEAGRAHTKAATGELTSAEQVIPFPELVAPVALDDGQHPFVSGTWAEVGGKRRRGAMTKDMVVVERLGRAVKVVLPRATASDPGTFVGDGTGGTSKVRVTFTLKFVVSRFQGGTLGTHVMLVSADPQSFNDILAHELGHTLGQAANATNPVAPGLKLGEHPHAYTDHGHYGPHCRFGLDEAATHVKKQGPDGAVHEPLSGPAFKQPDYDALVKQAGTDYEQALGTCIMYGSMGRVDPSSATAGFCDTCKPFFKAAGVEDLVVE